MSPRSLVLLLLAFPSVTLHAASNPINELIRQSEAMMKSGKAAEAADFLRSAAQKSPEDFYLVYNGGIASYAAGKYQDAIDSFTQACSAPDEQIRSLSLVQIGNAEFQLSKALLKAKNQMGAAVALERAVETYQGAMLVKANASATHNLEVAKGNLEKVLLSLGDSFRENARKAASRESKIVELSQAVTNFERATQINEKSEEARTKLNETRRELAEHLRDQARERVAKVEQLEQQAQEQIADTAKKESGMTNKAAEKLYSAAERVNKEAEKWTEMADASYQQARDNAPKDKELAKEHEEFRKKAAAKLAAKAAQRLQQADQADEKSDKPEPKKQEQQLAEAITKADQALAFDQGNKKAQEVKAEATKKLELAKVAHGEELKAQGEKAMAEEKPPSAAVHAFNEALEKFKGALDLNPENERAKEQLAKTQEELAKALTAAGKKEMAMAQDPAVAEKPKAKGKPEGKEKGKPEGKEEGKAEGKEEGKPEGKGEGKGESKPKPEGAAGKKEQKPPGEKSPEELREEIGHTEKAAQSFAQAEALAPGKNDAASQQAEALAKLSELRASLDQQQNKPAPPGPPTAGGPPSDKPGGPSDKPGQPTDQLVEAKKPVQSTSQAPVKPTLNFSDIRSAGEPNEGTYKDLRQKSKFRDW